MDCIAANISSPLITPETAGFEPMIPGMGTNACSNQSAVRLGKRKHKGSPMHLMTNSVMNFVIHLIVINLVTNLVINLVNHCLL